MPMSSELCRQNSMTAFTFIHRASVISMSSELRQPSPATILYLYSQSQPDADQL
jgi:hypothetical protein